MIITSFNKILTTHAHAPTDSREYGEADEAMSGVAETCSRGCQGAMAHSPQGGRLERYYYLKSHSPIFAEPPVFPSFPAPQNGIFFSPISLSSIPFPDCT